MTQHVLRRFLEPEQYTSLEFTNRLDDWKLKASYGSVGDCFDCEMLAGSSGRV